MEIIKNKKILVIGGAGFIGSHLCDFYKDDNNVYSLDNYLTGNSDNHLEGVEYIRGSSGDIFNLGEALTLDYIFHLGEYSRVETSFDDYNLVIENNLKPFSKVLEFSRIKNAKLIYSGSSTKFAKYEKEDLVSPYAWIKSSNTNHLINYSKWFGLKYAIVYFYNVYGGNEISRGKYSTVIAKFKNIYSQGVRKLPLVKPGTQTRNFTHYSDIISGLNVVALKGDGDGYGIGSSQAISMNQVIKYFGCDADFLPSRRGNRFESDLITEKTKKLGWEPKVSLEKHINEFLDSINK